MAQEPQQPTNSDSFAGRPPSPGMKIGFLLAGSPDEARVYAVLIALPLLEGVSGVRLAWSDASQAEFTGTSSFSAPLSELIDRLSDELLHLPGFNVQIQGVNRVPHPVLVFRAEPGEMDRNASRRRTRARSGLVERDRARRGTAQILRPDTETQPARSPGAGVPEKPESDTWDAVESDERPAETTWAPGRMASTVREPGFEDVTPRLHPAERPRPDPIEPVVRSHSPLPSPVDAANESNPGDLAIDWLIDAAGQPGTPEASASEDVHEGALDPLQVDETIGTVLLDSDELPEEDEAPWEVLVSDFYPDIEALPRTRRLFGDQPDVLQSEQDDQQWPVALSGASSETEKSSGRRMPFRRLIGRGGVNTTRNRAPRRSLLSRAIEALFGSIDLDSPADEKPPEKLEKPPEIDRENPPV